LSHFDVNDVQSNKTKVKVTGNCFLILRIITVKGVLTLEKVATSLLDLLGEKFAVCG
jgi:hypothetical protein